MVVLFKWSSYNMCESILTMNPSTDDGREQVSKFEEAGSIY